MSETEMGPLSARRVWVWDLELADVIARRVSRAFPTTVTARTSGHRGLRAENKRRLLALVRKAINDLGGPLVIPDAD